VTVKGDISGGACVGELLLGGPLGCCRKRAGSEDWYNRYNLEVKHKYTKKASIWQQVSELASPPHTLIGRLA